MMKARGEQVTIDLGLKFEVGMLHDRRRRAQAILADAIRSDAEILALAEVQTRPRKARRSKKR